MKNPQIQAALNIVNQLIPLVEEAESQFKSAKNWSCVDVIGFQTIATSMKKRKLNKAVNSMNEVHILLQKLSIYLSVMPISNIYRLECSGFETFADFLFEGNSVDDVTSKIQNKIEEVKKLKEKLKATKELFEKMY